MTSINNNNNIISTRLNQINNIQKVEPQVAEQKQVNKTDSGLINRYLENQAQINHEYP